jgi:glycogen debranching enzyme
MSDPDLAGLKSGERWLYASSLPLGNGDPGRFHALFGRDSLISSLQLSPCGPMSRARHCGPSRGGRDAASIR